MNQEPVWTLQQKCLLHFPGIQTHFLSCPRGTKQLLDTCKMCLNTAELTKLSVSQFINFYVEFTHQQIHFYFKKHLQFTLKYTYIYISLLNVSVFDHHQGAFMLCRMRLVAFCKA